MYGVVIFVLAVAPAFLFGWFLPSLFTFFGEDLRKPFNKRSSVLALLLLPWLLMSGWWMLWLVGYSDGRFGNDTPRAMMLALVAANLSTLLRQKYIPAAVRTLHDWFERLDEWMRVQKS